MEKVEVDHTEILNILSNFLTQFWEETGTEILTLVLDLEGVFIFWKLLQAFKFLVDFRDSETRLFGNWGQHLEEICWVKKPFWRKFHMQKGNLKLVG